MTLFQFRSHPEPSSPGQVPVPVPAPDRRPPTVVASRRAQGRLGFMALGFHTNAGWHSPVGPAVRVPVTVAGAHAAEPPVAKDDQYPTVVEIFGATHCGVADSANTGAVPHTGRGPGPCTA